MVFRPLCRALDNPTNHLERDMEKKRRMLKQWGVISNASSYTAPECRSNPSLAGVVPYAITTTDVFGNETTAVNKQIMTGQIVKVRKRHVWCQSGDSQRLYVLCGDPHPRYLEFLESKGMTYDGNDPLRSLIVNKFILNAEEKP